MQHGLSLSSIATLKCRTALVGALALLAGEASGLAADFTHATVAKRVSVKETLGPELITNGGFDDASWWGKDAQWSISGGVATSATGGGQIYSPGGSVEAGKLYKVTFTVAAFTSGSLAVNIGNFVAGTVSAVGTYTFRGASSVADMLRFGSGGAFNLSIDNVSMKEVKVGSASGTLSALDYSLDAFLSNGGTSPKLPYDATGTLAWSPHNMVLQSETLNNATWGKSNLAVATDVVSNPITGAISAEKLTPSAVSGLHGMTQSSLPAINGASYTLRFYAKAAGYSWIYCRWNLGGDNSANFNVSSGTLGTVGADTTASIIALPDGWYECKFIITSLAVVGLLEIYICQANNTLTHTGDGASGVYIWGVQINRGPVPTAYLSTTTDARYGLAVDHDPVTLAPRGLLSEPAATNLQIRSQEFDNTAWTKQTSVTATANQTAAPDGATTADQISWGSAANDTGIHVNAGNGAAVSIGSTYTMSIWVRADVAGGTVGLWEAAAGEGTEVIHTLTTTWKRVSMTFTATVASVLLWVRRKASSPATIYLWGAQVEAGSVATSHIPTFAATVTRAKDKPFVLTSKIPFSATEGTLYAKYKRRTVVGNSGIIGFTENTNNETIELWGNAANPTFRIRDGSVDVVSLDLGTDTVAVHQITGAYKANDCAGSFDGAVASTDIVATMPTVNRMHIGDMGADIALDGWVEKVVYVPRRVSNADLPTWRYAA